MLEIFQVGHDPASDRYVRNKIRNIENEGLSAMLHSFERDVSTKELVNAIKKSDADCIMVQLPLPDHINKQAVLLAIPPEKDIDGCNPHSDYYPLTPSAIMRWLREQDIDIRKMVVTVLGRSELVGHPLADMLIDAGATVISCNSKTENPDYFAREADIVISAIGKAGVISYDYVSMDHDQIWIDVGINPKEGGGICGDVSPDAFDYIVEKGGYCSPVPGGVGKWTQRELTIRQREMENRDPDKNMV